MDKHLLLLARCFLSRADRQRHPNVIIGGTAFAERGALLLGLGKDDRQILWGMGSGRYDIDSVGPAVRELGGSFATFVAPGPLGSYLHSKGCEQDPMDIFGPDPYLVFERNGRDSLAGYRGRWHDESRVTAIIAEPERRVRFIITQPGIHFEPDLAQSVRVTISLRSVLIPLEVVTAMPDTAS